MSTAHVEIYREHIDAPSMQGKGDWRWRYVASNGRVLADSGEGYKRRSDCLKGAATVLGANDWNAEEIMRWTSSITLDTIPIRDLTRGTP